MKENQNQQIQTARRRTARSWGILAGVALTLSFGTHSAMARAIGIDVSRWQGTINWTSVKGAGITFAWAQATRGLTAPNSNFVPNMNNGKAAGVYMGAYHYAFPNQKSAATEANYFWNVAGPYIKADGKTLMPMLDMEEFNGHVGASSYTDWANQWCNAVVARAAAVGVTIKPAIYLSACNACKFNSGLAQWGSDIANYNGQSPQTGSPWSACANCNLWGAGNWNFWQYTDSGSVAGISGAVDMDVFNGTPSQLAATWVARGTASLASSGQRLKGDFNGDGKDDVVVAYDYGNANTGLWMFSSSGSSFASQLWWSSGAGNWDALRSQWVAGDFNNDGKADVGALYDYGSATSRLFVALSTGTGFAAPVSWWSSGAGGMDAQRAKLAVGDFNADGRKDISIAYDYSNARTALLVFISTGTAFSNWVNWWDSGNGGMDAQRCKWVSGDFNTDGKTDVAAAYDYGSGRTALLVFRSTGSAFNTFQNWWDSGNGGMEAPRAKWVSGDFNADGRIDVAAAYNYGSGRTALLVFRSTGTVFNTWQNWWDSGVGNWEASLSQWVSGDFNGDGKADVSALYNYGNSHTALFAFPSSGAAFPAGVRWWDNNGGWDGNRSTAF